MPFEIIRNDIANVQADIIVNTANPRALVGDGTDAAIHAKAGPQLLEARKKIGDILPGHCDITPAYGLNAKYVVHTVGPVWQGGNAGEEALLEQCFRGPLELAVSSGCNSIAFPLISTGTYGFPKDKALQIAISVFSSFLMEHEIYIYLVVWDQVAFLLSRNLFHDVRSYIDEHYISQSSIEVWDHLSNTLSCGDIDSCSRPSRGRSRPPKGNIPHPPVFASAKAMSCSPKALEEKGKIERVPSLDELLSQTDAGFSETLLKLIDQTGKKDSTIYKKANVSKQHFSKIRNNPDYKPTKATAVAFAIALELDLEQTRDLIGRAGYALTNSSKFDVIIMYFISRGNYDMFQINMTLFEFDQITLGV